ncbi:hypothetical protein [Tessaracoccus rhinocerotis]|uniref:hypothetical protein n=1 Tax=Tessaracoccus rhinocerotis TaxID=1689449 RepID=UPI00163D55F9|nr:hypothetical protein [Tessaracoccus rhinocerotis]
MSRQLESWAQERRERPRVRVTWFSDVFGFAGSLFGLCHRRPQGAPPKAPTQRLRLGLTDLQKTPNLLQLLTWRLDYQVAGLDALSGLQPPVIFAVNEAGVLDWQVLRAVLPSGLRATIRTPSRSLARGNSVVLFTEDPVVDGEVGEFTPLAAQLASQYNVPIVPVALVGTFKLNEVLGLALQNKPHVSVRFGSPIYVRGRSLAEATGELQSAVGQLFHTGDLSWWTVQHRRADDQPAAEAMPRWRRLWQQTTPRVARTRRRIWRRPSTRRG